MKKVLSIFTMVFVLGSAAYAQTSTTTTTNTTDNGSTTTTVKKTKKHHKKTTLTGDTKTKDVTKTEVVKTPDATTATPQAPAAPKSAVKFDQVVYNFGEVPYGSDVSHTFSFKNTSGAPVAIKDVGTSCGCTTPGYSKEPVAPGKTGNVTAKYDSSRIGGFNKTLTVYINDEQIHLTIQGTVKEPKSTNTTTPTPPAK